MSVPRKTPKGSCCRIVLTGGPGGGKTTAADLFRREIGPEVVVVPEAATLLFAGGFPRVNAHNGNPEGVKSVQSAIFHVQKNLENIQFSRYPDRILLCDRGTVDGAAYWPGEVSAFFDHVGTTLEHELSRYDAVLFFETAAAGGLAIEGGNPQRIEGLQEAIKIDQKLRNVWSKHPRFVLIPHETSFLHKMQAGIRVLQDLI